MDGYGSKDMKKPALGGLKKPGWNVMD